MALENLVEKDKEYIANTYSRFNLQIVKGEGCILTDVDGKEYIDCASGIGVNAFGVNDEEWKNAVIEQLNKVQHVCNLYYSEPQVELAEKLCIRTGAKKVFFANSGAEANECAIKTARKYGNVKYGEGRNEIITLKNSFHGRTMATLTATGQDAFHKNFMPFLDGFKYAEPNMKSVISCYSEKTCAVMIEVIQGESGVNPLDMQFVKDLEKFCKERDILLICDEVQSGNGRTGRLYGYFHYDIYPDIVTTAKGLGGGLPLGACLMFDKCEKTLTYGDHGSTFGGNPVACAGAISVLDRLTIQLMLEVQGKGAYLKTLIEQLPGVNYVSGMGLMLGVSITKDAKEVAKKCLEKGLIVLTAHDKIRLLPPLIINKEQIEKTVRILKEVLSQ